MKFHVTPSYKSCHKYYITIEHNEIFICYYLTHYKKLLYVTEDELLSVLEKYNGFFSQSPELPSTYLLFNTIKDAKVFIDDYLSLIFLMKVLTGEM